MKKELDKFTHSYIQTMLWTERERLKEEVPDDFEFNELCLTEEARERIISDCEKFQEENEADLSIENDRTSFEDDHCMAHAGHDFWLTRNGHGAGFWDGDWAEPAATRLTASAKRFGEVWIDVEHRLDIC